MSSMSASQQTKKNGSKPKSQQTPTVQPKMGKNARKKQARQQNQGTQTGPRVLPRGVPQPAGRGWVPVDYDEFIATVNGSTTFVTTGYYHNPGQVATFPLTSKEAAIYEKHFAGPTEYYYKPRVSQYATNGQSGKVMLSFDYDAADPPPATTQQVESTDPHADGMPYDTIFLKIDPVTMNEGKPSGKYVRTGGVPGGEDIKTYDDGVFYVSTDGNTNTNVVGEVRVRGRVWFRKRVFESTTTAPNNYRVSLFQTTSGSESAGATTVAKIPAVATAVATGAGGSNSSGTVTLPQGNYMVFGQCTFLNTGANCTVALLELLVNGVAVTYNAYVAESAAFTSESQFIMWFVQSTGTTTVSLRCTATYASGTETLDASLGFLAI